MRCLLKYILILISVFLITPAFTISIHAQERVVVFAASSVKDALDKISADFEAETPDIDIVLSYASSGVLARQIANGAPADIFLSANEDWMGYLVAQDQFKDNETKILATNELVVVASQTVAQNQDWSQVLANGRFAMGDPSHVPAGTYAKQALETLSIWGGVSKNAVFTENIRVALSIVERGEVNAGILYKSDAQLSDELRIIHVFTESDHERISYPIVRLNRTNDAARLYFEFVSTARAQSVFNTFGFNGEDTADISASLAGSNSEVSAISLWPVIYLSLQVAFVAMLFAVPIAYSVAFVLARYDFRGKALVQAVIMMPLVMPPVVTGYLLLLTFGTKGEVGQILSNMGIEFAFKWSGAALAAGLMAFPLLVRPMRLSIEAVDQGVVDAANTLGAGKWTRFRTIFLPLSLPGIIAGTVLGFAKSLGEFGATITFVSNIPEETQTISLAIYSFLQSPNGDDAAFTLMLVSITIAVGAVLLSEMLTSRLNGKGRS